LPGPRAAPDARGGGRIRGCGPGADRRRPRLGRAAGPAGAAVYFAGRRRGDFARAVDPMEAALAAGPKLVFVSSPNNPTGNAVSPEALERLLAHETAGVVDGADAEFAGGGFVP